MNRRLRSGSRANRDRRDQAFARAVIAEAERRRREGLTTVPVVPEIGPCIYCGDALSADQTHHPYCGAQCAINAESD